MRFVITILLLGASLLSVQAEDKAPAGNFVGSYFRGNHTGYNVTLNLNADGNYNAYWDGCLGRYGTAEGDWEIKGDVLVLSPTKETDMMKGHLRRLIIRKIDGEITLLPEEDDKKYKDEDDKRLFSFARNDDEKKPSHPLEKEK